MIIYDNRDIIDGRYHVSGEIGRGGMGCVLRVTDAMSGDSLALKYCPDLDETARRRFSREVRIMARINHPHVMSVLAHNDEHNPPYFTMPIAENSVADEIRGNPDVDVMLRIFMEMCMGVQAIHNIGSTHRDIKPENAMRMRDGRVVITDLGLAKLDDRDTTTLTQTAMFLGTRLYCAPEQLIFGGSREADARTDVFQLGKVLYALLTGEQPAYIDEQRVPGGLSHIVGRATQQHPDRRYQTVVQLMDAVQNYIRSQNPQATANSQFELLLEQANSLSTSGRYDTQNLQLILDILPQITDRSETYIEQFERIPHGLFQVMAEQMPNQIERPLEIYCDAIEDVIGGYNFAHAEKVADLMSAVYSGAIRPAIKVLALKTILIAAVKLGRFAAMEVFDRLLQDVNSQEVAVPVAEMLRENRQYYDRMIGRIPENMLHAAFRIVNQEYVQLRQ